MTRLRGLSTMDDGRVVITVPASECVHQLMYGGGISTAFHYRDALRQWLTGFTHWRTLLKWHQAGEIPKDIALCWEAIKFYRDQNWRADWTQGRRMDFAAKWIVKLDQGGLSELEAVRLICEKDYRIGAATVDIVDVDDLPKDRTNRNLWRRSLNGGPIWIGEAQ